jgi:hypothetical protein
MDSAKALTSPRPTARNPQAYQLSAEEEAEYEAKFEEARARIRAQRAANEAAAARRREVEQAALPPYKSSYDDDGAGTAMFFNQILAGTLNQIAIERQLREAQSSVSPGSGQQGGSTPLRSPSSGSPSPVKNAPPITCPPRPLCECAPRTPGGAVC